jgi:hypothetical protein
MEYNMSIDELNRKKNNLIVEKMKMDKFFSMFLEKFERKMDSDNTNTPIWKLYKSKLKEYEKIDQEIKTTNYWINKEHNV